MNRIIFSIAIIFCSFLAFAGPGDTINQVSEPQIENGLPNLIVMENDSALFNFLDSLGETASRVNTLEDAFRELPGLIGYTLEVKNGIVILIKDLPKPSGPQEVLKWRDVINDYLPAILPVLLTLITAFFRVIKKSPAVIATAFGRAMKFISTEVFISILGVILMVVSLAFFNQGAWTVSKAATYLLSAVLGGVGIHEVLQWVIKLIGKLTGKEDVPA